MQSQNTNAGITIFSVQFQHLKSSLSAFRPALSNLWLLLVYILIISVTYTVLDITHTGFPENAANRKLAWNERTTAAQTSQSSYLR